MSRYLFLRGLSSQEAPAVIMAQETGSSDRLLQRSNAVVCPFDTLSSVGKHPRRRGYLLGSSSHWPGPHLPIFFVNRGRVALLPDASRVFQECRESFLVGGAVQFFLHLIGNRPGDRVDYHISPSRRKHHATPKQPGEPGYRHSPFPQLYLIAAHRHFVTNTPS